jgi:TonB family protein
MVLRCLLFSSDEEASRSVCQVLAGLDVEGESCSDAGVAAEKITHQPFQIVIVDWDHQPEASSLLKTARERKASERALTLALVSDDVSVPEALRAGANSILRKPVLMNQAKDTLTTARDLLRAKQESALAASAAASVSTRSPATIPLSMEPGSEKTLRAGEFLQSSGPVPSAQFVTESESETFLEPAQAPVDPLQNLEPIAAAAPREEPALSARPALSEPRGLAWYMNARAGTLPRVPPPSQVSATAPTPAPARAQLLGYEQTTSAGAASGSTPGKWAPTGSLPAQAESESGIFTPRPSERNQEREKKTEAELFAYISGVGGTSEPEGSKPPFRIGKRAVMGALALAACTIVAAPQAPWHPAVRTLWAKANRSTHAWLNPQLVTATAPAPAAHEDFGRAGDEYKLPVAETIPDATTDPSQIRIVPMVDPTAKQPNNNGAGNTGQTPAQVVPEGAADSLPNSAVTVQEKAPEPGKDQPAPAVTPAQPASDDGPFVAPHTPVAELPRAGTPAGPTTPALPSVSTESGSETVPAQPTPARNPVPTHYVPANVAASSHTAIPSSLRSQLASSTPEASGNRPPESALPSIEPVTLPEAAVRALLTDQPDLAYPASAKGQQGTVVLQVLIGRDGAVQDAKFMQGSLAFARAAIDNVKLWHFKPYLMNGRAASVQSPITVSFKPSAP